MVHVHPYGKPERILEFGEENKITTNDALLKKMLDHPEVKNRKIVAFSIIGPFRKGKSFFLDYCLRFLYANYPSINQPNENLLNPQNWMGDKDEGLKGFSWRSGTFRDTTGIMIWNDVFLHTDSKSGDKIAIIVIDTQGLFDNDTASKDNSRIFALGTLISSIQVLNLSSNIQEDELQYLQFATDFAKFATSDNYKEESGKPFQNLLFLIRDWQNPKDYKYGTEGGQKYLGDILKTKQDQKEELKSVRQFVYNSFEKLDCALFPYPGEQVAIDDGEIGPYNGSWGGMRENFKKILQQLIENLLAPEKLERKRITGNELTCAEYKDFIMQYFNLFQSEKMPQTKSIYETTIEKYMEMFTSDCIDDYKKSVAEHQNFITTVEQIGIFHDMSKYKTLAHFNESKKMGSKTHTNRFKETLENEIKKYFLEWNDKMSYKITKENEDKERIRLAQEEENRVKLEKLENKLIESQKQAEMEIEKLSKEIEYKEILMQKEINEINLTANFEHKLRDESKKHSDEKQIILNEKIESKLTDAQKQAEIQKEILRKEIEYKEALKQKEVDAVEQKADNALKLKDVVLKHCEEKQEILIQQLEAKIIELKEQADVDKIDRENARKAFDELKLKFEHECKMRNEAEKSAEIIKKNANIEIENVKLANEIKISEMERNWKKHQISQGHIHKVKKHPYGSSIPLQYCDNESIIVDYDIVDKLFLHPDVRHRKIVVVSIAGAYRKGKSFFLDYCLRYLYANYRSLNSKNKIGSSSNWIGDKDEPLEGFSWKHGSDADTNGILIWSDIFLHNDNVAIALIDTQGLFEPNKHINENTRIFGLSNLISSVQIYNLMGVVQENELENLEMTTEFTKYVVSSNNQTSKTKPFQNLVFLIRDWTDKKYSCGYNGGQKYLLENVLDPNKSTGNKSAENVRRNIKNSFDKIECFLLSHPGEKVTVQGFDGRWCDLNEEFVTHLVELIESIFAPKNLIEKRMFSMEITSEVYRDYILNYFDLFKSKNLPKVESIFETTVCNQMSAIMDKLLGEYKNELENSIDINADNFEDNLTSIHDKVKSKMIQKFKETPKMGNCEIELQCTNALEKKLNALFDDWRCNIMKQYNEKKRKEDEIKKINLSHEEEKKRLEENTKNITENLRKEFDEKLTEERKERRQLELQNIKREPEYDDFITEGTHKLVDSAACIAKGAVDIVTLRSTSDRSGKDCCGQWFNGPPLRFLVALVALGGVACTLGGATLGSIALAGSPTSHLTAGLLMTGILVAIAIPINELPDKLASHVFVSYNFEANYNMPNQPSDAIPGPYVRLKLGSNYENMNVNPNGDASDQDVIVSRDFKKNEVDAKKNDEDVTETIETTTENYEHNEVKRSLMDSFDLTRKYVYRVLESRISVNGFNGKKCLLRAICESAQHSFLDANGILGHIVHIILTPSTSMDENLPLEYSKAENLGYQSDCQKYIQRCDFNLLDSISKLI